MMRQSLDSLINERNAAATGGTRIFRDGIKSAEVVGEAVKGMGVGRVAAVLAGVGLVVGGYEWLTHKAPVHKNWVSRIDDQRARERGGPTL